MDDTVRLVNAWAEYKNGHPASTIEEFCRHYLIAHREAEDIGQNFGGVVPPQVNVYLVKLLGRILQCCSIYVDAAFEHTPGIKQMEDFYFLNSIRNLGEMRKRDAIRYTLVKLSSVLDIIKRLVDNGFIEERPDPTDRRARLVKATPLGEQALFGCYEQLVRVNDLLWSDMAVEDKKLCIQLLRGVEIKHSKLAVELKGKTFDEMVTTILGVREKRSEEHTSELQSPDHLVC